MFDDKKYSILTFITPPYLQTKIQRIMRLNNLYSTIVSINKCSKKEVLARKNQGSFVPLMYVQLWIVVVIVDITISSFDEFLIFNWHKASSIRVAG